MSPKHAPQYKVGRVRTAKTPSRFLLGLAVMGTTAVLGSVSAGSARAHDRSPDVSGASVASTAPVESWTQDFLNLIQLLLQLMEADPPPKPDPRLLPANWAVQLNTEYAAHGVRRNLSDAERTSAQNAIAGASRLIASHPEAFPDDVAERTKATLQSMSIDLYSKP